MRAEAVAGAELLRDFQGEVLLKASLHIDRGELAELSLRLSRELRFLTFDVRPFRVAL